MDIPHIATIARWDDCMDFINIGGGLEPFFIVVQCPCGRSVEYHNRVPSDTLVFDLQFRLRCTHCNARVGFRIAIPDERTRGDN